jgi:hypothetical protein
MDGMTGIPGQYFAPGLDDVDVSDEQERPG